MFGQKRVPSREGGVEVVAEELATRFVKLGHNVTLLNRKGHNVAGKQYDNNAGNSYKGAKIIEIPTIDRKGFAAASSSFFATLRCCFSRYDVVHIHCEGPAFFCWLLKIFRKKVIVTIHGLDYQRSKWGGFATWYLKKGEQNAVKYADEIIVLSKNNQNYFMNEYGRKTIYIPNGVSKPDKEKANEVTAKFGLKKDSYILFLGRIVPEKGIHYLIRAYRNIKTDKKLVIAGGVSDTAKYFNELKELAAGDERIIFTGFVQGKTLSELYSNAYIYVLPSDLEGMPLSLLEAMSYGNCCLVSDIEECASVVEKCGVLFSKSNVRDLEEKLNFLLNNPDNVKAYKKESSDFICQKYNWDDVCDKTIEVYRM